MASTSAESPASPEVSCKECHNGEPGHMATFKASDTVIELAPTLKAKPDVSELVFGKFFTDHMLTIEWTKAGGWQHPHISPIRQLSLHPGCSALHYAIQGSPTPVLESYCPVRFQSYLASDEPHLFSSKYQEQVWLIRSQLFEGLKAYWGQDGQARLFRPMLNMKRMVVSAKRACLPSFDCEELLECIRKLVKIDQDWIPRSDSASLYIRPTLISTESSLGVKKPTSALLFVILSPVSSYFRTGMKPVSLWADIKYVRAWKGGTGDCKLGGNYGATIYAQYEAENLGCQQVLWLYGDDHQITEVGTMNVFIHWTNEDGEEELATPPLDGLILPGITRQSILELSQKWGEFKVSERYITMADLLRALKENRVKEIFGSGTACVVSPVGCILYQGENLLIPCKEGFPPLASRLLKELIDIQYGRTPSEWSFLV